MPDSNTLSRRDVMAGGTAAISVPLIAGASKSSAAEARPHIDLDELRSLLHDMQNPDLSQIIKDTYDYVRPLAMRLEAIIGPGEMSPDADLERLADKHDAILATTPENAPDEVNDRITDEAGAVLHEMFRHRASTFAGVRAKMRWLRDCPMTFDGEDLDARMMRSIARDIGLKWA